MGIRQQCLPGFPASGRAVKSGHVFFINQGNKLISFLGAVP
jgi:hypothetical protein